MVEGEEHFTPWNGQYPTLSYEEPKEGTHYFRYTSYRTAPWIVDDEYGGYCREAGRTHLRLEGFKILKKTAKGVWVEYDDMFGAQKKFILNDARKKFACPTKKEALESFIARKKRQLSILEGQKYYAQDALQIAEKELGKCTDTK